jgi:hypothetical protein
VLVAVVLSTVGAGVTFASEGDQVTPKRGTWEERATAAVGGSYRGRTGQGRPVQFEVAANKFGDLFYKVRIPSKCNQPSGWRPGPPKSGTIDGYGTKGSPTPPARIKNGKFRLKNKLDRTVPPLAKGEFVTKRKVEGKVAYGCISNSGKRSYRYVSFKAKHV